MLVIEGQCPYCNEKRGFKLFAVSEYKSARLTQYFKKNQGREDRSAKTARFYACGVCFLCNQPVIVDVEIQDNFLFVMYDCIENDRIYEGPPPEILSMIPAPVTPYSHPALPDKVRPLFVDLQSMLKQNLAPSLIIAGCRSVLEEAVKELGGHGSNLYRRIEDLKSKAIVNGVLYDWATSIRNLGNDATHELKGEQEEAAELVEFTKLFLQYTFEFPARVQEKRRSAA